MGASRDELVQQIGRLVMSDPRLSQNEWDGFSMVNTVRDGGGATHSYRYWGDGEFEPSNPRGNLAQIREKLHELRELMAEETGARWHQCLIQIWKPGPKINIDFEYDDPARWQPKIKGLDMSGYAEAIRPPIG